MRTLAGFSLTKKTDILILYRSRGSFSHGLSIGQAIKPLHQTTNFFLTQPCYLGSVDVFCNKFHSREFLDEAYRRMLI